MAENYTKIITKNEDQNGRKNLLSLFTDFRFNFPPFNRETKPDDPAVTELETVPVDYKEEINTNQKQDVVKFSDPKPVIPPPLKLEVEDNSNPAVQWLVYALGGFLVAKWVWARWKERKERAAKKDLPDDKDTPTDDGHHHSA